MLGVQTFFKSYQSTARICVDFAEAGINTNGQVISYSYPDEIF